MLYVKFGFDWPCGFREEEFLNWWMTDDDDGLTLGASLPYKLTYEPSAQVS